MSDIKDVAENLIQEVTGALHKKTKNKPKQQINKFAELIYDFADIFKKGESDVVLPNHTAKKLAASLYKIGDHITSIEKTVASMKKRIKAAGVVDSLVKKGYISVEKKKEKFNDIVNGSVDVEKLADVTTFLGDKIISPFDTSTEAGGTKASAAESDFDALLIKNS